MFSFPMSGPVQAMLSVPDVLARPWSTCRPHSTLLMVFDGTVSLSFEQVATVRCIVLLNFHMQSSDASHRERHMDHAQAQLDTGHATCTAPQVHMNFTPT